ncbi:hypothetical protein HYW21_01875 [Candidatus Woesearchaeota archaeon]|nr:hypothetical protein [Candidatus Woesearchaeota archaeon]
METKEAYDFFEQMIQLAVREVMQVTCNQNWGVDLKKNNTPVTKADKQIDKTLTAYAKAKGFSVISEEGDHEKAIVQSASYVTIDPIDGTLGYIAHVEAALASKNIKAFLDDTMKPSTDFCLLIGIVEQGKARFGCCYHYLTKERIFIDSNHKERCITQNKKRLYTGKDVLYTDPTVTSTIVEQIKKMADIKVISLHPLGLTSQYCFINDHANAATVIEHSHPGIWDLVPGMATAQAFGGVVADGNGDPITLNKYIMIPGNGCRVIRGERFLFLRNF